MFSLTKFPHKILGLRGYSQVANWPSRQQTMLPKNYAERQHAVGTTRLWLWFNILITAPALVATILFTVPPELEHLKHLREQTPTWTGYSYMRKRTGKQEFAWGPNSLFHSDYANAVPPE